MDGPRLTLVTRDTAPPAFEDADDSAPESVGESEAAPATPDAEPLPDLPVAARWRVSWRTYSAVDIVRGLIAGGVIGVLYARPVPPPDALGWCIGAVLVAAFCPLRLHHG